MPKGSSPPETLSKEDILTLAAVRRDIWSNAAVGAAFGGGSGFVLHTAGQWGRKLGLINTKFNRNTLMLSILGPAALGMFVFSVATGKQEVHNLHPIFRVGANDAQGELNRTDYQRAVIEAQRSSDHSLEDVDVDKMEEIRLTRRKSLMDSMKKGHGLSDSHGGHWVKENED